MSLTVFLIQRDNPPNRTREQSPLVTPVSHSNRSQNAAVCVRAILGSLLKFFVVKKNVGSIGPNTNTYLCKASNVRIPIITVIKQIFGKCVNHKPSRCVRGVQRL